MGVKIVSDDVKQEKAPEDAIDLWCSAWQAARRAEHTRSDGYARMLRKKADAIEWSSVVDALKARIERLGSTGA